MTRVARSLFLACVLGCLGASHALGQAPAAVVEANDAQRVADARAAIAEGTRQAKELAPIYLELALALARLGDASARAAFIDLLALDPEFRLGRDEAEEVRAPYLEARGFWTSHRTALALDIQLDRALRTLHVTAADPAGLAARLRLRARTRAGEPYLEKMAQSSEELTLLLPELSEADPVEYSVTLIDEHGNRLLAQGSDEAPLTIAAAGGPVTPVSVAAPQRLGKPVIAGVAFGVAAGALVGAMVTHVLRQHEAERWNRADCEGEGDTRDERCGAEHDSLLRYQRTAGVLYGVSAAALITGAVMLFWPRRHDHAATASHALACDGGNFTVGARCRVSF